VTATVTKLLKSVYRCENYCTNTSVYFLGHGVHSLTIYCSGRLADVLIANVSAAVTDGAMLAVSTKDAGCGMIASATAQQQQPHVQQQ